MKCAETFCEIAPTSLFSPYLVSRITLSRYRRIKEGKHKVEAAQTFAGVSARFRQAWAEGPTPKRTQGGARCLNDTPLRPGKQREGVTRPIPVRFDPHRLQFEEVVTEAQDTAAD